MGARHEDINKIQEDVTFEFIFVDQEGYEKYKPTPFKQVAENFLEYKT